MYILPDQVVDELLVGNLSAEDIEQNHNAYGLRCKNALERLADGSKTKVEVL